MWLVFLVMVQVLFFFVGNWFGWIFMGVCIGMCVLIMNWQIMMVVQVVVVIEVYKMFDVYGDFMVQIIFYGVIMVDYFVDLQDFCIGQVIDMVFGGDGYLFIDVFCFGWVNVVDIVKCDYYVFVCWNVDVGNMGYDLFFNLECYLGMKYWVIFWLF